MSQILSVLGPISPETLGRTLTHEHLSLDFEKFYTAPPKQLNQYFQSKINLHNIGYIRQYPYGSKYNVQFYDADANHAVTKEIVLYKEFGGGSIVENTSHGLKRNLKLCYNISKQSNVNIIAGTGHYVEAVQIPAVKNLSVEELVEIYTKDIIEGCDIGESVKVRCGFIGEVGSNWPISDFEQKVITATAIVQQQLNCGVSFHPGRNFKAPFEIMRIYLEAGGKAEKSVMSHLDRTILDDAKLFDFAELGSYCQFDLFGTECSFYQLNPNINMPSDGQRIDRLINLIKQQKEQILISHDIHTKHRLVEFGGHGYSHIMNNILPRFKLKGVSDNLIDKITIENPQKWLEFII